MLDQGGKWQQRRQRQGGHGQAKGKDRDCSGKPTGPSPIHRATPSALEFGHTHKFFQSRWRAAAQLPLLRRRCGAAKLTQMREPAERQGQRHRRQEETAEYQKQQEVFRHVGPHSAHPMSSVALTKEESGSD